MKNRLKRFTPVQRLFHSLLMISFLVLGATGLSRLYIASGWGRWLADVFGGYTSALVVHRYAGFFMICGFAVHGLYLVTKINARNIVGPDSLLPRAKDITDFFAHVGWFFGLRGLPRFDRWGYWEKFDYWAVFWGMVIIGITGLMMAFPMIATQYMPGWGLNLALWVHRIEAFLAMAHVFVIHFFIAHLRCHNFPMDQTMFEGSADLDAVQTEKPSWIDRLKQNGELEPLLVAEAGAPQKALFYLFGYAMVAAGLFLLIGA
ncbi:MAG: cytochrome b/b6 domain-containing protein, partial [Proteobacteria bacterium]|nr:cytochrome b/b6 domain-containing protein [Pseudomonadota bacterium]